MTPDQRASYRPIIHSLAWDIALNATIPFACYSLSKSFISPSELSALLIATAFPTLKSIYDLTQHRRVNPVAVMVLFGIATSIMALFIGGDPRILLIRESLFTGAFGVACLASLLFPRPIMFYFGRYFFAGNDPEKRKVFEERWQNPIGDIDRVYAAQPPTRITQSWPFCRKVIACPCESGSDNDIPAGLRSRFRHNR